MVTILQKLYFGPIPHNLTKPFWQEIWFLPFITYQRLLLILGLVFHSNSKAWQWPWLLLSWALPTYANADIVVSTTQHQVEGWSFIGSNIMGRKYTKAMGWAVQMRESLLTKSYVLLYHTYNKSMVFIIQNPLKKKITA